MSQMGSSRLRRAFRIGLFVLPMALLAGCVRESTNGSETIFKYEFWVPVSVLLAGIVAVPAGWAIRKHSGRFGWGLLIVGPLAMIFFAPSLFRDQVTVSDDGFHVRTGIWGLTAVHDVKLDDLRTLKITSEKRRTRRGRTKTSHYFLCELKSGGSARVPINNNVTQAAAEAILKRVVARKIPIIDETEE